MAFDQIPAIRTASDAFWNAFAAAGDLDARVPCCPDWNVADLGWHLAEVHWFWTSIVEQHLADEGAVEQLETTKPSRPEPAQLEAFGRAQAAHLIEVLDAADPNDHVWTWTAQQDVAFVRRHQVQEAVIHRWDMESATTAAPSPIDGEVASDALDELLTVTLPALRNWNAVTDATGSVHLHCTDVAGEWMVRPGGEVEREHAKGDAAMRGTGSELLLALVDRVPLDGLDVVGDRAVAESFVRGFRME